MEISLIVALYQFKLSATKRENQEVRGGAGGRSIHLARRASFWEVWWIPSPILDARLLNSERADVAAIDPSRGPAPLLLGAEEEGTAWRRALSTAAWNSLVRSRNDACAGRVGFMAAAGGGSGAPDLDLALALRLGGWEGEGGGARGGRGRGRERKHTVGRFRGGRRWGIELEIGGDSCQIARVCFAGMVGYWVGECGLGCVLAKKFEFLAHFSVI